MDILEFKSFKNIFQERWVSVHTAGQPEAPLSGTAPGVGGTLNLGPLHFLKLFWPSREL